VDRKEQEGRARVESQGLSLLSLLTIEDLLAVSGGKPQA
jgi:orotate phosphoribosyltransferase